MSTALTVFHNEYRVIESIKIQIKTTVENVSLPLPVLSIQVFSKKQQQHQANKNCCTAQVKVFFFLSYFNQTMYNSHQNKLIKTF